MRRERLSFWLFVLALLVTASARTYLASVPYTYAHGFVSADVSVAARSFARFGIVRLGGVPVNNNAPIGPQDAYTHWPPLLPIVLSCLFRIFGESVACTHMLMLAIELLTALLVYRLARDWLGPAGGALAGFFWLTLPVVVHFGQLAAQQSLAMMFMMAAVWAFPRSRWGAVAALLAVWSSWEAVLLAPGLWLVALKRPNMRRSAILYSVVILAGTASIAALYAWHNPELFADALQTARYRMGLSNEYSHRLLRHSVERYMGTEETIGRILWNHFQMLGLFGASAASLFLLSRPKGAEIVICGLGAPWLLWSLVMRNHVALHQFEVLLAAPLSAIALAWIALGVREKGRLAISAMLTVVMVQPWVLGIGTGYVSDVIARQLPQFGVGIRNATPDSAVVLSPLVSAVPVYFSERHLVRNISGEEMLRKALPELRRDFQHAPFYLAVPPSLTGNFVPRPVVAADPYVVVMHLD